MRRIHWLTAVVGLTAVTLLAGCSPSAKPAARRPLSQAEHDSVLARQKLPGAVVVGRALKAKVQAETRAADIDAKLDSLPR